MARWRRRILRIALGLFGFVALCVVLALLALANLDARPMKGWVVGAARDQGIALDYDAAGVTLGGLTLRNVRIASPEKDAPTAPNLVSIRAIDGHWSPFSKRVDDLVVKDVAITLVIDKDGVSSLDRFLAGLPPSEPTPPTPLSQLLGLVKIEGVEAHARIEGLTLTLLRAGQPPMVLTGLAAEAALKDAEVSLAVPTTTLTLTQGERQAKVQLALSLATQGDALTSTITAALVSQSLDPSLPAIKQLVDFAATTTFVPTEQRTAVKLERLALLDGAVKLDAQADLFDEKDAGIRPVVRTLTAFVDLVAVARAVPKAYGPLTVEGEPLRLVAEGIEVDPVMKGKLTATGKLTRVVYRDIEVEGLGLEATARPDGDGFQATLSLPVAELHMPGLDVTAATVEVSAARAPGAVPITFDAKLTAGKVAQPGLGVTGARIAAVGTAKTMTSVDAKVTVDVDRVAGPADVEKTHLVVDIADFVLAEPALASTGKLGVTGTIAEARLPGTGGASDLTLTGAGTLGKPGALSLSIDARRASMPSLAESVGPDFRGAPLALKLDATDVALDPVEPRKTRGKATFDGRFGGTTFSGSGAGSASDLDFALQAATDRAGPARGVKLVSRGHYGGEIRQESTVDVTSLVTPSARLAGARVSIKSSGTLDRQHAELDLGAAQVSVNGKSLGQTHLDVVADVDLRRPALDVRLRGKRPETDLELVAGLEGDRVKWSLGGKLAKLGPAAPFLPAGPDWDRLSVQIDGRGTAGGVIRRGKGGSFELAPDPAKTARGRQTLEIVVRDLHYRGADEATAEADTLTLAADVTLGGTLVAKLDVDLPALTARQSGVNLNVEGLRAHVDLSQGKHKLLADVAVDAKQIKQSALPSYPVRDLAFTAKVAGDPDGALTLETRLVNAGAATELSATGELERRAARAEDAVAGRHALILEGKLAQDLAKLDGAPDELRGTGKVTVPFRVESGDLTLFRTSARIILADVTVLLPKQELALRNVRGELPIVQEIVYGANGVERVGTGANGIYQRLRFSDHRPYLGDADYLALEEARYGEYRVGPLAGNIRVDRDIVAVDQLEMSALGGKIAGQVLIGLADKDTRIDFRGKLTGIRPTKGEDRLDANAALTLVPYRLGMEGRIEIVRISKRHLLDLLNLYDPYRADVASNRVRLGLIAGYPKRVRLFFQSGFARMEVELGGLVGGVRIDPIEGIPIGPALSTWLAPVLEESK